MTKKLKDLNLADRLLNACVVCHDCGTKYGKYSVGCSSSWNGICQVCGEEKPITEVRDYGYLTKGLDELKGNAEKEPKKLTDYMFTVGPITEPVKTIEDHIIVAFNEDEIGFLNQCLDIIEEHFPFDDDEKDSEIFKSIEEKIETLYDDYCVSYELSPALKAYHDKYGTWGTESEAEMARWEGFRDAFIMNSEK